MVERFCFPNLLSSLANAWMLCSLACESGLAPTHSIKKLKSIFSDKNPAPAELAGPPALPMPPSSPVLKEVSCRHISLEIVNILVVCDCLVTTCPLTLLVLAVQRTQLLSVKPGLCEMSEHFSALRFRTPRVRQRRRLRSGRVTSRAKLPLWTVRRQETDLGRQCMQC